MNLKSFKQQINQNIKNIPGWNTRRKMVVIESDDWGSIRMPSKEIYEYCLAKGYRVDKNLNSKYDSLASEEDLSLLFNTLTEFKDSTGRHPVITANCLVANPDFEKIRDSGYRQYYHEPITTTFARYPKHAKNWEIWKDACNEGLFYPQSHGREHLNVSRFMSDLKSGNQDAIFAVNMNMPGIFAKDNVETGNEYVVALEHCNEGDKLEKKQIISEGLEMFKDLFQKPAESFIACNYTWHPDLEQSLINSGVKYIQGSNTQYIPKGDYTGFDKKYHYMGQKNNLGLTFLVRNSHFEPSMNDSSDWVNICLNELETAFRWNKPAIISTHRINYVGYIDPKNRDKSLYMLRDLFKQILKKWPEVEFVTSVELGDLISKRNIK